MTALIIIGSMLIVLGVAVLVGKLMGFGKH